MNTNTDNLSLEDRKRLFWMLIPSIDQNELIEALNYKMKDQNSKITWKDVIANSAESSNICDVYDFTKFSELLNIDFYWNEELCKRMKQHYVYTWMCTDTQVGISVYYLDGVPVAVSTHASRKCNEQIQFISKELMERTKSVIISYIEYDEPLYVDLTEEIDKFWIENAK